MLIENTPHQDINLSNTLHRQNIAGGKRLEEIPSGPEIFKEDTSKEVNKEPDQGQNAWGLLRDYFSPVINGIAIVANTLSAIGIVSNSFPEKLNNFLDKKSEWFSKFVVPISFASNGLEALAGQRLIEASLRFIPAISFWALPMFNFTYPMGLFSGSNTILSMIHKRLGQNAHYHIFQVGYIQS